MAYRRGTAYYRSRRVGRSVASDYLGSGEAGRLAAEADNKTRAALREARAKLQEQARADRELDAVVDNAGTLVRTISEAMLLCNRFHSHRGQWRKLRTATNSV